MDWSDEHREALADLVCLVYHEGRDIQQLTDHGEFAADPRYAALLGLPRNGFEAWRQMAQLRTAAASSETPTMATNMFAEEYGLSLPDLRELFDHALWRGSCMGGTKWVDICRAIQDFIEAIESGARDRALTLLEITIPNMSHNTGTVLNKLRLLKTAMA